MSHPHPVQQELDDCSREPIHIPGSIQPHGALVSLQEPGLEVVQASSNAQCLLGLSGEELRGRSFLEFLEPGGRVRVAEAIAAGDPARVSPLPIIIGEGRYDALFHRSDGLLVVELEPAPALAENFARHHRQLQRALTTMQQAADLPVLFGAIAGAVSELTGYDRVMVYRFDADWHGEVVGEVLTADVDSYMGLHFPASDIPEQARALYSKTWLRIIPTIDYTPATIQPPLNPHTGRPLDLSFSVLRSVSPVHLEYLRNMNVGASMSISLIVRGKLWGLIACHHQTARPLPYAVRAACELFGQVASAEIAASEKNRRLTEHAKAQTIQTRFFDVISEEDNPTEALLRYTPSLLEFMGASGAAICRDGQYSLVGVTPPKAQVRELVPWLRTQVGNEPLFATDFLSAHWPPAAAWREVGSGLLAIELSRVDKHWLLWFRPEVVRVVNWAGNPEKPVEPGLRLHPRKSFASWQQAVMGRSLPWSDAELEGALELRLALNALVIRRTEKLLRLNTELERKNTDLNSFAYIASHDLKEPLRGIFHFARFLREDHAADLGDEGLRKVDTIAKMASHTNDLLTALAGFSKLGRMELTVAEVDVEALVDDVLTSLTPLVADKQVEIRRPRRLPVLRCDPVLMREVFVNLISNAAKYNTKDQKWVELSFRDPDPEEISRGPVISVADNGIGIRERNFDSAFQMFRRLNKEQFPEGTGAGLAIAKSIIERHGGRLWMESTMGEGTTFFFTLR